MSIYEARTRALAERTMGARQVDPPRRKRRGPKNVLAAVARQIRRAALFSRVSDALSRSKVTRNVRLRKYGLNVDVHSDCILAGSACRRSTYLRSCTTMPYVLGHAFELAVLAHMASLGSTYHSTVNLPSVDALPVTERKHVRAR